MSFSFALKLLGPVTPHFKFNQTEKSQKFPVSSDHSALLFPPKNRKRWNFPSFDFCLWVSIHLCAVFISNWVWPKLMLPSATIHNHFWKLPPWGSDFHPGFFKDGWRKYEKNSKNCIVIFLICPQLVWKTTWTKSNWERKKVYFILQHIVYYWGKSGQESRSRS